MKLARTRNILALTISTLLLATGCGGGSDDEAGSIAAFSVVPSEVTVTGAVDTCPGAGTIMTVRVYGGTAPYRLDNAFPDRVALDRTTVNERGGSFIVSSLGRGCLDSGSIVVRDTNERQVIVSVTLEKGS